MDRDAILYKAIANFFGRCEALSSAPLSKLLSGCESELKKAENGLAELQELKALGLHLVVRPKELSLETVLAGIEVILFDCAIGKKIAKEGVSCPEREALSKRIALLTQAVHSFHYD